MLTPSFLTKMDLTLPRCPFTLRAHERCMSFVWLAQDLGILFCQLVRPRQMEDMGARGPPQ